MRLVTLTVVLTVGLASVLFGTACKDGPVAPAPPGPLREGVTLIQRGAPPYQPLRYQLTKGTTSTSQVISDLDVKNDGQREGLPSLVFDLETAVDDVLADGSAVLRVTVLRASVRERPDMPPPPDVVRSEVHALQGLVFRQTLAGDGSITESRAEGGGLSDRSREQVDSLHGVLQQMAMRLPAEPVGVGALWREKRTLPDGGIRAASETTYTITSIHGSSITYTSAGLSNGVPHSLEQDGMKVEVTNTRGHSQAKGTVDLSRYAFAVTSTSMFATAMNVVAPKGTPGAGPSSVEIAMAFQVTPTESVPAPAEPPAVAVQTPDPAAPDGVSGAAAAVGPAAPDGVSGAAAAAGSGSPGDGSASSNTAAADTAVSAAPTKPARPARKPKNRKARSTDDKPQPTVDPSAESLDPAPAPPAVDNKIDI